jgi:hypothetical protein
MMILVLALPCDLNESLEHGVVFERSDFLAATLQLFDQPIELPVIEDGVAIRVDKPQAMVGKIII